jgi:transposase
MATSIFKKNFPGAEKLQEAVDTADYIIGLDLHKKTTAICVVDRKQPDAPMFERKQLKNNQLPEVLLRFAGKKVVACEAAYGWHLLREALHEIPMVTFVPLDARKTAGWIKTSGIKNDKIDAQVLCATLLHGGVARLAVHQPGKDARNCWQLIKHRDNLVRQRSSVKRQLTALQRDHDPNPYTGEVPDLSDIQKLLRTNLDDTLVFLNERIADCDRRIVLQSKSDSIIERLKTIPGIGPVTAFALRHKIESLDRFEDAQHLCSYLGLGVRQRQSGEHSVSGKITKTGNDLIRRLLVQGAQVVRFRKPDLPSLYFPLFGQKVLMNNRIHANKVVVALARKHLTFVFNIWKHGESFDLERYRRMRNEHTSSPGGGEAPGRLTAPTVPLPSNCVPSREAELGSLLVR